MNLIERIDHWLHRNDYPEVERVQLHAFGQLLASLFVMAWFVEARDPYTGGHLWRVSRYARLLATAAGLSAAEVARIGMGGFLHDLGKIGVPDAILRKPDRLTGNEYTVIRTHPEMGARMLAGHPLADMVRESILSHHERPDGNGYPHRLARDAIPLEARIVAICDAFDAMTSTRPYRRGMDRDQALAIIADNLGAQFEGELGEQFIGLGRAGHLNHVLGHSDEGVPLQACPVCGPTLVVRRGQQPGEHIYCRNCGSEFVLEPGDDGPVATVTGRVGTAADLEVIADEALVARLVAEAVQVMPVSDLWQRHGRVL